MGSAANDNPEPGLECKVDLSENILTFEVSSQSLAKFVELSLDGADLVFSDNYFDLPARSILRVKAPCPPGWTLEAAKKALHIRSLRNTYD